MKYKVKGINDDRSTCECCGKTGLKRVVWIENLETGEIRHFGTTCAMSPQKGFGIDKEIKRAISRYQDRLKSAIQLAGNMYRQLGLKYVPDGRPYSCTAADPEAWDACYTRARMIVMA